MNTALPWEHIPQAPGVYLFKKEQEILYIGKAKALRRRVASYFSKRHVDWKIEALLQEYTHIEHLITGSEQEALLLEAKLIQDIQPRFNVLLKSGQPFIYLVATRDQKIPELLIVRNKKVVGTYYGPFIHKRQARNVHQYLIRTFRLSRCKQKNSTGCLQYHIGYCAGTCLADFDEAAYRFRVELACSLLENKYEETLAVLKKQIAEYSNVREFEKAAHLYTYMQNIDTIFATLRTKFGDHTYKKYFSRCAPTLDQAYQEGLAHTMQQLFILPKPPLIIDCFDISHFQSSFMVGACIRFNHGLPDKNKFRRFAIKTLKRQNDYAALQEIVQRRYRNNQDLPDLILIDGGKGQLSTIAQIMPHVPVISLAKKEELIFSQTLTEPVALTLHSDIGKLFIALRDYTHHFAISYHQLLRKKHAVA